jgi:hypothetical protein
MGRLIFLCLSGCSSPPNLHEVAQDGVRDGMPDKTPDDTPDEEAAAPPPIPFRTDWDVRPDGDTISDAFLYRDAIVHQFRIVVDDAGLDSLSDAPKLEVVAGLDVNGEPDTYPIALRLKGTSSFRTLESKPAFKVDFHEWDPTARFHGIKRLTLNNMVQDPTMLHEHVYYWLCTELGVPAPRHAYARVWLNGEELGLYGIVETMDEQFVNRVWPEDDAGPLYEAAGGDFVDERREKFEVEEVGSGLLAIDALVTTVLATPPDQFLAMLETHFDLDALLTYWALDIVSSNPDGYVLNHNNYYVYGAPLAGKWTLIPSGVDRSFVPTPRQPVGALALGCVADPDCEALLHAQVGVVADTWDRLDVPAVVTALQARVGPLCDADPRRERECRGDELLDFIATRTEDVRDR